MRVSWRVDGAECLAQVVREWVGGGDGLPSGLDLNGAVAAGGLDEFPDRPAGLCLGPAADGKGGEHFTPGMNDRPPASTAFWLASEIMPGCSRPRARGWPGIAASMPPTESLTLLLPSSGRIDLVGKKSKQSRHAGAAAGVVKWFSADEGWGVIEASVVPGGCFMHFSSIQTSGYRALRVGQPVRFTFEQPGFLQDGCPFRALKVWPDGPDSS